jgi:ABC-type phosphate/phosphonate transport system substrate-binding protein
VTIVPFVVALPMYDGGDLAAANDALWQAVRDRIEARGLGELPRVLTRHLSTSELWSSEGLLLSQICGYPFACRHAQLAVVAAPAYAIEGCTPTHHRSFVVVRARSRFAAVRDLAQAHAVINEIESVTGRHLLGDAVADVGGAAGFFSRISISGSHAASLAAVAHGEADVAAIDCITHHHLARQAPALVRATRILHVTRPSPVPPFVIARDCGEVAAALVAEALAEALGDPRLEDARRLLGLAGLSAPSAASYESTLALAKRAHAIFAPDAVQAAAQSLHSGEPMPASSTGE